MKITDFSPQFPEVWGDNADSSTITYPIPSTVSTTGRASLEAGFTTVNMTPLAAGGIPPFGQDFNGILKMLSTSAQHYESGLIPSWSATFAANISGYPLNAIVADPTTVGLYWRSTVDSNTSTPGATGASWVNLFADVNAGRLLNIRVQTSSGTYIVPAGVTRIRVRVQGAGGAGGGSSDNTGGNGASSGSSGSAGAYAESFIAVTPGTTITCSIGAGGIGATAQNGGNGGNTSFGPIGSLPAVSCPGGSGGFASGIVPHDYAYTTPAPAQTALPTGANIVFSQSGAAGLPGLAVLGSAVAQSGGNSFLGSGGGGIISTSTTNHRPGYDAQGWGGGGGAHANQQGPQNAGGAGASGIIIIEEYSA